MGRIKTSFIKGVALEIFERYGNELTTDFEKNKELIKKVCEIKSKRLRNMITGYVTVLKKRGKF